MVLCDHDSVSHCVVQDIVLHSDIVRRVEDNSTLMGIYHGVAGEGEMSSIAAEMRVKWISSQRPPLSCSAEFHPLHTL